MAAAAPVMEAEVGLMTMQPSVRVEALEVRLTVPVKPPEGVMVMVPVVEAPGATVTAGALTARAKEAVGAAPATVRLIDPAEVEKLLSPEYVAVMVCVPAVVELKL